MTKFCNYLFDIKILFCYTISINRFKGGFMIEKIAMWGGIAGIVVALFAIIILFLTRKNILDILQKDVILFDRNFELKKSAIEHSFRLIDRLEQDSAIIADPVFKQEAKDCYNELLCVVSDLKVAYIFYNLAI